MEHASENDAFQSLQEELNGEIQGLDFDALGEPTDKRTEWLIERKGLFTASQFGRLTTFPNNHDLPAGGITYATECALEIITDVDVNSRDYRNSKMDWGNDNEGFAAERTAKEKGLFIENYGSDQKFIKLGEHMGCTPDGVVFNNGLIEHGIETKCPDSKTHLMYLQKIKSHLDLKIVKSDYYWQCVGSIHITGAKSWFFISYDPRFKNESKQWMCIEIKREDVYDDILLLRTRVGKAIQLKQEIITEFG